LNALAPREAYRLWAPTYDGGNAVCVLEDRLVSEVTPPAAGKRLLDAGCGVGLRLKNCGAGFAVGIDASPEMVTASGLATVAAADVRALPFAPSQFDLVWCRLLLGYLPELEPAYAELARVCRPGGHLLASDFHAEASRAGHRQTFRDTRGVLHEITHYIHDGAAHLAAARTAGLSLISQYDGVVGPDIRFLYEKAGKLKMYERDRGLPIVAAFLFRKD
jgi:malonyl-CoA O-methyltransferase